MVEGIGSWREAFRGYEDCYTVIGGAACDILMSDADLSFRATKDIDMILLLEDRYKEFASVFWNYIKSGKYKCGWKNSDEMHFYRFTDPQPGYPIMIELFSRKPNYHLEVEHGIIPIHIDDDVSSLSAILLNDDFYYFMIEGRETINGISVLRPEYIIPFKMYAWLDLNRRKLAGEHVNEKDYKKHKYDVFRLLQIVNVDSVIETTGIVYESIKMFIDLIVNENLPLAQLGLSFDVEYGINLLKSMYGI